MTVRLIAFTLLLSFTSLKVQTPKKLAVTFGDNKGAVYGLAIGDLDGDGSPDIAAARSDAPNVVYFGGR